MDSFRKADAVALYNADILIVAEKCDHRFHDFGFGNFAISGNDIAVLAKMFGYHHNPNKDIQILRDVKTYGEDFSGGKVLDVFVRIDAPQMITIRVREEWHSEKEPATIEQLEFLYCGKFSIQWETT